MKTMASSVVLLLALAWSVSISPISAKYQVYIINYLDKSTTLTVHCASKDNDLGTHDLTFGDNFNWSFKINLLRTTLFYCDMSWGNVKGHFDVFIARRDAHRCSEDKCYWKVQKDGLYLYISEDDEFELQYSWPQSVVA